MQNVKRPDLDLLTRKKLEEYFDKVSSKVTILLNKDLKKLWLLSIFYLSKVFCYIFQYYFYFHFFYILFFF